MQACKHKTGCMRGVQQSQIIMKPPQHAHTCQLSMYELVIQCTSFKNLRSSYVYNQIQKHSRGAAGEKWCAVLRDRRQSRMTHCNYYSDKSQMQTKFMRCMCQNCRMTQCRCTTSSSQCYASSQQLITKSTIHTMSVIAEAGISSNCQFCTLLQTKDGWLLLTICNSRHH